MMQKLSSSYFIFFYLLSYLIGGFYSFSSFASSISLAPNKTVMSGTATQPLVEEAGITTVQPDDLNTSYNTAAFILPLEFITPPRINNPIRTKATTQQAGKTDSNPLLYPSLSKLGEDFVRNNKDNDLVQDSLVIYSDTKRLIEETDFALHILTQNIAESLNLSLPLENSPLQERYKSPANTPSYTDQITKFNYMTSSERMEQQIFDEAYSDSNLFKHIFNIQNLLYLFGLYILFSIIKKCIMLFIQRKQKYRYHRR